VADYDPADLDPNIRTLVQVLNGFEGIHTTGSCGGHPNPEPYQQPEGSWDVTFRVDHTEEGWWALEWLTWLVHGTLYAGAFPVHLMPTAAPPYLNTPGQCLQFYLVGIGADPEAFAAHVEQAKAEYYCTPAEWAAASAADSTT